MSKEEIRTLFSARLEPVMQEIRQWLDALHAEFAIDTNNEKGNHHEL